MGNEFNKSKLILVEVEKVKSCLHLIKYPKVFLH